MILFLVFVLILGGAGILFLLGLYRLSQVVAVLRTKHTADLAILPEEALAAGIRLVIVVSDPID